MASRRTFRRILTRKRAIWVNIPFASVAFTETVNTQQLLVPEDWESQFSGNANETCTLRAIVGELIWSQTAVGTAGNVGYWGIYLADKDATVVPTFSVAGMSDVSWLRTGSRKVTASVTASAIEQTHIGSQEVSVMAKRKLTSRDAIYIAAQFGTDAATPAGTLGGILRFLIARN